MMITNLHLKALTCASLRASHHTRVVDQDVNLREYQYLDISLVCGYQDQEVSFKMYQDISVRM